MGIGFQGLGLGVECSRLRVKVQSLGCRIEGACNRPVPDEKDEGRLGPNPPSRNDEGRLNAPNGLVRLSPEFSRMDPDDDSRRGGPGWPYLVLGLRFGVWGEGLGFRVWGLGFWVLGLVFGVWGLGIWVQGLGLRVED